MLGVKEERLPFGMRPSKGSFGKKPSNGSFGKKPSNGSFGKKPSTGSFGKKTSPLKESALKTRPKTKSMFDKPQKALKKRSNTNIITAEERLFLDWLHSDEMKDEVCFVCGKINPNDPIEWHHVKRDSSSKKNHKRLIPLCGNAHHRLGELSPHNTPKLFRETYSMEEQNRYADAVYSCFLETRGGSQ